jgi:SNF2 family DNA or RNA helicase
MQPLWDGFKYKPHQVSGIHWLLEREEDDVCCGGLLCDEMGLGKTIQMIGLIKNSSAKSTLALLPLAVVDQWISTAQKAGITCWTVKKEEWFPIDATIDSKKPNVFICNYERAIRTPRLVAGKWDRLICDEAHRLSSTTSQCWKLISALNVKAQWFLTGTPIVNGTSDLKALFELLKADINYKKYILCRTMQDLRSSIPDAPKKPIHIKHLLDFDTEEEADFYRGVQGIAVRNWKEHEGDRGSNLVLFQTIIRLRQLSLHPQVYIEGRKRAYGTYKRGDWMDGSTKFRAIRDLIEEEKGESKRWILFCHFHDEMKLLKEYLGHSEKIGLIQSYSGQCSQAERSEILKKTYVESDKHQVLLIQLQSGGVGLNLQHFERILFTGPWWTSALMEQAVGRAVRIGQTKRVVVHHLLLKEEQGLNIDYMMNEKAKIKGDLCRQVLSAADHRV